MEPQELELVHVKVQEGYAAAVPCADASAGTVVSLMTSSGASAGNHQMLCQRYQGTR